MVICVLANLGYVCQLYNKFTDRKSYWAMQAKEAFMKSVDMEVESRSKIPVPMVVMPVKGDYSLQDAYIDSLKVRTEEGEVRLHIPYHKFQHSYYKDFTKNGLLSILLEKHPIAVDSMRMRCDSLLAVSHIPATFGIRECVTDLMTQKTDTFCFPHDFSPFRADSLLTCYLGIRCEVMLTGYVLWHRPWQVVSAMNVVVLLLPWLFCFLGIFIFHTLWRLLHARIVQEKAVVVEKPVVVEKVVLGVGGLSDGSRIYKLDEGVFFDLMRHELYRSDGQTRLLTPQVSLLLKLFLEAEAHCLSKEEIIRQMWNGRVSQSNFHKLISALRSALREVSDLSVVREGDGRYLLGHAAAKL